MPLPSLKNIKWVTTDCYGTLIDWEKGIIEACKKEAAKDGFSFEEEPFLARFMEVQAEIMAGSYELYAEVLRRALVKVAGELGWEIEPSRAQFLPDSVAYWQPFREANAAFDRLADRYEVVHFCYEAGPTGYGMYRQIRLLGHECTVVAPSLVHRPASLLLVASTSTPCRAT